MSLFLKVVEFLVAIGVALTAAECYLQVNKLWKRKHEKVVTESISVVAQLLSFIAWGPFLIKFVLIDKSITPAVDAAIFLVWGAALFIIGVGYWVPENRGLSPFRLILRALELERGESTYLIKTLVHPREATHILEMLEKVSMVDGEVAEEEVELINGFARRWKIEPPHIRCGVSDKEVGLLEIREDVRKYLNIGPPKEQASQLVDLITLLIKADKVVTEEEELILEEISGMLNEYAGAEGKETAVYEVLLVPQSEAQVKAMKELMPGVSPEARRGGQVFVVDRFYSEKYADVVSKKYIDLGMFSVVHRV